MRCELRQCSSAQAAAILLLVGGSSGVTYLVMTDGAETSPVVANVPALVFEPVAGSFGSMYHLGPDYQDARRSLVAKVDAELSRLTPEERADVRKNIAVIRTAIEDINKALAPDFGLLDQDKLQRLIELQKAFIDVEEGTSEEDSILEQADVIFGALIQSGCQQSRGSSI